MVSDSTVRNATRDICRPKNWSLIVASNDDVVLGDSLLRSPELSQAREVIVERGHSSAAAAYNSGIARASGEVLVFIHQDVYLPAGWFQDFSRALLWLEEYDPDWGVLGSFGKDRFGKSIGFAYSAGLRQILGGRLERPAEVATLDEMLLVLRRSSGMRFDEKLPGFHLYGTDVCLQARSRNLRNYAVSAFCVHNSNAIPWLPWSFWRSLIYIQRKWAQVLPVHSPCICISRNPWPVVWYFCWKARNRIFRSEATVRRCDRADLLYNTLAVTHGREICEPNVQK